MNEKEKLIRSISTALVECVLFVVLGYPNATALRAPIIIVAFAFTLFRKGIPRKWNRISSLHWFWALSIIILVLISKVWAYNPQGIDDVKKNVLWSTMITIIMADYVTTYNIKEDDITKLLVPVALFYLTNVVLFGTRDHENRLLIGNNANYSGLIAVGMMSFFLYSVIKNKCQNKLYLIIAISLMVIGLLSGSRKAVLSIVVYFVLYYLFFEPSKNYIKTLGRVIAIFGALFISYVFIMNNNMLYNTIGNRVESLFGFLFREEAADGSVNTRMNMITIAVDIIKSHPLRGIGANNYKYYTYYNTYSHNGYTEILCSFGIIGAVIYYLPVIRLLRESIKNWKINIQDAIFPLSVYIAFFVCEAAGVSYFTYYNYCFLGIVAGLCVCMSNSRIDGIDKQTEVK